MTGNEHSPGMGLMGRKRNVNGAKGGVLLIAGQLVRAIGMGELCPVIADESAW